MSPISAGRCSGWTKTADTGRYTAAQNADFPLAFCLFQSHIRSVVVYFYIHLCLLRFSALTPIHFSVTICSPHVPPPTPFPRFARRHHWLIIPRINIHRGDACSTPSIFPGMGLNYVLITFDNDKLMIAGSIFHPFQGFAEYESIFIVITPILPSTFCLSLIFQSILIHIR